MKKKNKGKFDDIMSPLPSAMEWNKQYTLPLTERKAQRGEGVVAYAENPAFDANYETFQPTTSSENQRSSQSSPSYFPVDSSKELHVSLDDEVESYGETRFTVDDVNPALEAELPSTSLRKIKGLARPGSVRHKIYVGDRDGGSELALNGKDPQSLGKEMMRQQSVNHMTNDQLEVDNFDQIDAIHINKMTVSIDTKRTIRRRASQMPRPKKISGWKQFKFNFSLKLKSIRDSFKDSLSFIDLWHSHLKNVQGTFGSGVLSYFLLLRWLFWLNLFITGLNLLFLFIPQIVYDSSPKHNNVSFTGLELITGEGWFKKSELYFGSYTNQSIPVPGSSPYHMPLAYLFVGGGYLLLCLLILMKSMALSYRDNFITGDDSNASLKYFTKVFCSWDHAVFNANAVRLKQNSIYNDLLESLGESKTKVKRTRQDICCLILIRLFTNIVVLGLLACSVYLILMVADGSVKIDTSVLQDMLPAITISGLNLIIPFAFRIVASLEQYRLPQTVITVSLARTIVLKLASISVYVVALHDDVTCSVKKPSSCKETACWETFIGTSFYKLVVVDFIFLLIAVFFGEFVRRILAVYIPWCSERLTLPGFDISRNVLDLIYTQGICWVGTFYSPLLPLINIVKLFILFYIKRYSVMKNCRPSMRPFNASKMNLLFLALLGLALLLAMIVLGYVIINSGDLRPSANCGPFRGRRTIYSVVIDLINEDLPGTLRDIVDSVSSANVIAAIIFLLGLLAYYFKLKKASGTKKIQLLKEQIALAGRDKLFLIRKLKLMIRVAADQTTVSN